MLPGLQRRRRCRADFHEIAEDLIILDFQALDACLRGIVRLQLGKDDFRARLKLAKLVERRIVAARDETAVATEKRKRVGKRAFERLREGWPRPPRPPRKAKARSRHRRVARAAPELPPEARSNPSQRQGHPGSRPDRADLRVSVSAATAPGSYPGPPSGCGARAREAPSPRSGRRPHRAAH